MLLLRAVAVWLVIIAVEAVHGIERTLLLVSFLTQRDNGDIVSIEGEHVTLKFPNGTIMTMVPIRYLCDDSGYWRK